MKSKKIRKVAILPAYNEEKTIAKVIIKTQKHVDEVIVVDDGSTDMTATIAEKLGAKVIRHDRNMGYGAALRTGLEYAAKLNPDVVITIDADDQHDPDDIPGLIGPILNEEADVVIGSRFLKGEAKSIPTYRKVGIKVITALTRKAAYKEVTDAQSGYRAYDGKIIGFILPSEVGMGASTEILLKAKDHDLRVREVPVDIRYDEGSSTQNPLYHGLDVVLSTVKHMSMKHPLIFYGCPGFLALIASMFFWIWTLRIFTTEGRIVTNIALMAIGATIVGLMLLTTAVILWTVISVIRERY